jgi:trimeric autotransporter adhesin
MATQVWLGNAAPVAQITTLTPATPSAGDTFTVTCNAKAISYVTAAGTVADVCNGLANALNNNVGNYAEFKEFTAQNTGTTITLTGDTAGLPFTVSLSVTTSGSATFGQSTGTAATGPNDWGNAANWSTGSVPVGSDDVFVNQGKVPILYGLDQHTVTLNSLNIYAAYTGTIGLPPTNPAGYAEYRTLELKISATTVNVGQGAGTSSGRIKLNVGTVACTLNVYNTGQALDSGIPSLIWHGTSSSNVVNVNKGAVGIAFFPGEAGMISALNVGYVSNIAGDVQLICGSGCTITTVNQNGGNVTFYGGMTTLTLTAGTATTYGAGAVTTLNALESGTVTWNSTGTIATAIVADKALLDFSKDQRAKTVTNPIQIYGGGSLNDPFKVVGSLSVVLEKSQSLAGLSLGEGLTLARS